jgi:hypothetical protein
LGNVLNEELRRILKEAVVDYFKAKYLGNHHLKTKFRVGPY